MITALRRLRQEDHEVSRLYIMRPYVKKTAKREVQAAVVSHACHASISKLEAEVTTNSRPAWAM